jgi:hypothetical protein
VAGVTTTVNLQGRKMRFSAILLILAVLALAVYVGMWIWFHL